LEGGYTKGPDGEQMSILMQHTIWLCRRQWIQRSQYVVRTIARSREGHEPLASPHAESFERIHRQTSRHGRDLEFTKGDSPQIAWSDGDETVSTG
jgi:hypothetical protein